MQNWLTRVQILIILTGIYLKKIKKIMCQYFQCVYCTLYSVYVGGIRIRVGQLSDPDPQYFNLDPHYFNLDPHHWIF